MSRRRFFAGRGDFDADRVILSVEESNHLVGVLRLRKGDRAFVFDGEGREYSCRVGELIGRRISLKIESELEDVVESPLDLTLAPALVRGEKFDLIVQKSTELGVSRIIPTLTDHSDARMVGAGLRRRMDRWRRISLESLKQSRRRRLVEIAEPVTLPRLLERMAGERMVVFSEKGGGSLKSAVEPAPGMLALVGPEGGWSDGEIRLFQDAGCRCISLGSRVLRSETACIAGVALLQHVFGDLRNDSTD